MITIQNKSFQEAQSPMRAVDRTSIRDYHRLANRLEALAPGEWRGELGGIVSGYSWFVMRRQVSADAPTVLLTAGIHGDAPAGVEAALRWMEGEDWRPWRLNWLVLPCINPFGWVHNQRTNADGQDINRHFLDPDECREAEIVRRVLGRQKFLLALDLREDTKSDGYYLCETKTRPPFLGARIAKAIGGLIPLADDPWLDGRRVRAPGWVLRLARRNAFERQSRWPLAFHLAACCTEHFLCSKTPTGFPLSLRVSSHLAILQEALRFATEHAEATVQLRT